MRSWWALWNVCFVIGIDGSWRGRYAPKLAGLTYMFDMECNCDCPLPETQHELCRGVGCTGVALHDLIWVCILYSVYKKFYPHYHSAHLDTTYPSDIFLCERFIGTISLTRLSRSQRLANIGEEDLPTEGYPAQPGLMCLSVRLSVHACRLGVQRKMAQAQQIRSIILQNHESTMWIVNQKFFEKGGSYVTVLKSYQ